MQLQLLCNKRIHNLVFHNINKLFCNSLVTLLCIVLFEQIALNKMLCTEVSSQLFYSLFIMLYPVNSLKKVSELPYVSFA